MGNIADVVQDILIHKKVEELLKPEIWNIQIIINGEIIEGTTTFNFDEQVKLNPFPPIRPVDYCRNCSYIYYVDEINFNNPQCPDCGKSF